MKKNISGFALLLFALIGFTMKAEAHGIKETLLQDGAKLVASCTGTDLGTAQLEFFKTPGEGTEGYILFTNVDVDAQRQYEYLLKTSVRFKGHDTDSYKNGEIEAQMVTVGEGATPLKLSLKGEATALKVWLKAYAQGHDLKKAHLGCKQL